MVRPMSASMFASMTWLMAAAEAAANQMPAVPNSKGCQGTMPGTAKNIPTTAVKAMSITTFGLVSS